METHLSRPRGQVQSRPFVFVPAVHFIPGGDPRAERI